MPKILIVSEKSTSGSEISILLKELGYIVSTAQTEDEAVFMTKEFLPDVILISTICKNVDLGMLCKKLRLQDNTSDTQIIVITSKEATKEEITIGADAYITRPVNNNILIATINAHLRIKNYLNIFSTNNNELAKRFYQLKVLYDTSSKLAGTLSKKKLINVMYEGLEQSISYALCTTLMINNTEDITLVINSVYPITKRLEHALKLRAVLGYKALFNKKTLPFEVDTEKIKIEVKCKQEDGLYDLEVMNFNSIFSPISTSDRFFGTVEIMRETDLSGEDTTCFQTVISQVSLPLESAILYEEIKEKNLELEKLEKLKSEFISIVSHELRTPLTAIKNALDIMLSGKTGDLTAQMSNFLNMAKRNVSRLSGIINDLLDLSKIEAGKMELRFTHIKIDEPINFVINTFKDLAEKKNILIKPNIEKDLPVISGDIQKLEQVLSNMVSNAIKFTPKDGEIAISVKKINSKKLDISKFYFEKDVLKPVELKNEYIQVSIKDSGIGIKEEDIPKVFDKFQQIENSLSREVGGTGLGIPIAKQLIDAHGGYIWIESKENKGTTFSFILPLAEKPETLSDNKEKQLQN